MQKIIGIFLYIILFSSSLYSEDLINKYKNMVDTQNYNPETSIIDNKKDATTNKLSSGISTILDMSKNTFESTSDFEGRRNNAILKFEDKTDFFLKNGSHNYSAGIAKMKQYNPDTEIMTLILDWNKDMISLLSECNKFKTISFYINREEAKKLFKNEDIHFFHIKIKYINQKLKISEILLYGKYKLYKNINTQIDMLKNSNKENKTQSQTKNTNTCSNYKVTATQLNIRSKPEASSSVLGQINKNETICIYIFENGWARSKYGWISEKYLASEQNIVNQQKTDYSSNPLTHNNKSDSDVSEETSSSVPIFVKIIMVLIGLSLLVSYWKYAIGFIFILIVYQIFK